MKKTKMLKKNYEFRKVLSKGKYYSGKNIEAYVLENNKKDCNFLGLAISVKTAKAVKRNMIKRLLRENYKILENDIINGVSIVFLWKKGIDTKNALFNNIKDDMNYIFDKADTLNCLIRINRIWVWPVLHIYNLLIDLCFILYSD